MKKMNSDNMNPDLAEEIDYLVDLLSKSGFFSKEEILEILEDQFIEEDLDFSQIDISLNDFQMLISIILRMFSLLCLKKISLQFTIAVLILKRGWLMYLNCLYI